MYLNMYVHTYIYIDIDSMHIMPSLINYCIEAPTTPKSPRKDGLGDHSYRLFIWSPYYRAHLDIYDTVSIYDAFWIRTPDSCERLS